MSKILQFGKDDIEILENKIAYDGFFKLNNVQFRHKLFEGGWSDTITRELIDRGDAVAVLPYDAKNDTVILIEQIRIGAVRTSPTPWLLECIAGMIDKQESAETVAIREAKEEAGIEVSELVPMMSYLSSPGGTSERLYLYLAHVDSENVSGVYGLDEEGEDILVHVIDRSLALDMLNEGKIDNAATVICLQWLQLHIDKFSSANE